MNFKLFKAIGELVNQAKIRETEEHMKFLEFYRELVLNLPSESISQFGMLDVSVIDTDGKRQLFGIILTVTDYVWWKALIENGARFVRSPEVVKADMLAKFSEQAEMSRLTVDERKELLKLLESGK